jgi:hypothetical protein
VKTPQYKENIDCRFINKIIQDFKQVPCGVKAEDDVGVVIAPSRAFIAGVVKDIPDFLLGNALMLER